MTTWPGGSPWPVARVDRVASVSARIGWKALTASEYLDDGYVFLSTPNIKSPEIDFENVNYVSEFRYEESPELKLRVGDVLLAKDGSTLGITNLMSHLPRPATVNGSIAVIRPYGIESRYLRYVLASEMTQSRIAQMKDGMGVPHLFQWDINRLPIPLPPFEEQRRIADFLDDQVARIDNIIEARKLQAAGLAEHLRAFAETAVWGGLSPAKKADTGVDPAPPAPEHWLRVRNRHLLRERVELSREGDEELLSVSHLTGVTRRSEKSVTMFMAESLEGSKLVRPNDLVINTLWAWMGALGVCREAGIVSPAYGVYAPISPDYVPEYFDHLYRSSAYVCEMTRHSKGVWSSRLRLYPEAFLSLWTVLPPKAEQLAIVFEIEQVRAVDEPRAGMLFQSVELLSELKRSLISAAVSGEFDVSSAAGRGVPA